MAGSGRGSERWATGDQAAADDLGLALATGRATGTLRFRGADGSWIPVTISAGIVLLDQHTTAGLFTIRRMQ